MIRRRRRRIWITPISMIRRRIRIWIIPISRIRIIIDLGA